MNMNIIERDDLNRLVQALDLDPEAVRLGYSGRGMYGDSCLGLVIDVPDVLVGVALAEVFALDIGIAWEMARAARTDSMGYSTIIYFPGWTVDGAVEPADLDD